MKPIKVKAEIVAADAASEAIEVQAEVVDSKRARKLLESRYDEAEKAIKNRDKVEEILRKMEEKLAKVPVAGEELAKLPVFASLVRSYVIGKYPDVPMGTILAALGAIIYYVNPFDLVPDALGAVGLADDAAVVAAAAALINSDIEDYLAWREANEAAS